MVLNPNKAIFTKALEKIRARELELAGQLIRDVSDLIPPPPDVQALRGPSWFQGIRDVPVTTPEAPRAFGLLVEVRYNDGSVAPDLAVSAARQPEDVVVGTGVTGADGRVLFSVPFATYGIRVTRDSELLAARQVVFTEDVPLFRVDLAAAPPGPPAEPPPTPPPKPGPIPFSAEAPSAFQAGERVLAFGSLPATVLEAPGAEGTLYTVRLDVGTLAMAAPANLVRLAPRVV